LTINNLVGSSINFLADFSQTIPAICCLERSHEYLRLTDFVTQVHEQRGWS
jgi:hypothetical protein